MGNHANSDFDFDSDPDFDYPINVAEVKQLLLSLLIWVNKSTPDVVKPQLLPAQ